MSKWLKKLAVLGALFSILLCACFGFSACKGGNGDNSPTEDPDTNTFSLNMHLKEMSLYDTFTLIVKNYDDVTWVSDNKEIVSVDENGVVTAKAYGQANVSATQGDKTDSCLIIVLDEGKVPEIAINTDGDDFALLQGDTFDLGCNVKFNENYFTDGTFTYQSSNPTVASVDENGSVTAIALGETTISVQGAWRGFDEIYLYKEILLSVVSNVSMSLSTTTSVVYTKNETVDGVTYSNACNLSWKVICEEEDVTQSADIQWIVENPEVLSVNQNGKVTGKQVGQSKVYYTYNYDGATYISEAVTISVKAPMKSLGEEHKIYVIGTGEGFTISGMEGQVFAVRSEYRDYSDMVDVLDGLITFDEQVEKDLVGVKEKLYIDTMEYTYTCNVFFVTHTISTKDELTAFLASYSGGIDADTNNSANYYAILTDDIDCENDTLSAGRTNNNDWFLGTFDGMGHTIKNYAIANTGGLFGAIYNSSLIKDVAFVNVVGKAQNAPLVLGQTYGGIVQNVYVKGNYLDRNGYRGMFYAGGLGVASNCIVEIEYPADATAITNAFTGDVGGGLADSMYAIGNAKQLEPKSQNDKPYATVQEMLTAKMSYIVPENGWSEYWKTNEFGVYFNDVLILKADLENATQIETKSKYQFVDGSYVQAQTFTIGLNALLNGEELRSVYINGTPVSVSVDNVLELYFEDYTLGEINEVVLKTDKKTIVKPFLCVSHAISTKTELTVFLTSYSGGIDADTNNSANYYAVLMNDIDYENASMPNKGRTSDIFMGTFNGMGYAIKNYKIDASSSAGGGVFGAIYGAACIENVAFINAVGGDAESPLVLGQTYGGTVRNIYVKGSYTGANGYRGAFASGGLGVASNCIVDITYSDETTATTNVFTGATGGNLASSMYGIGNATQLEPKTEVAPYATVADMLAVNKDNIVSANGWSEYWSFDESGNLYFGDEKVE